MGIIRQGILGGFRKKTGSVVGAYWRGLDVIRSLPRASDKPATQAQLDQRFKFGLVTSFLSWITNIVDVGFKKGSGVPTPMNMAVSYHLKEAITGVSPDFTIDFTKVRFSSGKLLLPANMQLGAVTAAKVDYIWEDLGLDDRYKDATDMATLMAYNPVKQRFVTLVDAAPRSAETYSLQLPADWSGDSVHCYISFNSVITKSLVSDSEFVGTLLIL